MAGYFLKPDTCCDEKGVVVQFCPGAIIIGDTAIIDI
jgi:hypothetical protein